MSKSILDPSFRYTNSVETDLRKTFARIRREQKAHQPQQPKPEDRAGKIALLFGGKEHGKV